ncbi:MAG: Ivy family c-type lysozyme inhibitor [Alphaproteobacteria bacterium]
MRIRSLFLLASMLSAAAMPAIAQEVGKPMANLLRQPAYKFAWQNMVTGESPPNWVTQYAKTLDGPPTPVIPVELDGEEYTLGFTCKPNACEQNQLFVLFAPGGRDAWGMLATEPTGITWLGKPDERIQNALTGALRR